MILIMDIDRIIQVFVVQLGLGIVYLYIGLRVLKRDRKRLNQMIGGFYISVFIGMLLNVIYAPLETNPAVIILHLMTDFFLFFPAIFLLIFNLIILKSQKIIDTKKQILMMLGYGLLLAVIAIIPEGVLINESTGWRPVWSLEFILYLMIFATLASCIPNFYTSIKIYQAFQDPELKRKWKYYIIGMAANYVLFYGTSIANYINVSSFRTTWAMISVLLILITSAGVYVGIGQQMSKK